MSRARDISDIYNDLSRCTGWWWFEDDPVSLDNSYNVASLTDNGVGTYVPNLTNPTPSMQSPIFQQTMRTAFPDASSSGGQTMISTTQVDVRSTLNSTLTDAEQSGGIFGGFA